MYAGLAAMMELLPEGYEVVECHRQDGDPCGCLIPLKRPDAKQGVLCKVHGPKADQGAAKALQAIKKAGYSGPVMTQFPVFSEAGKKQSRLLPAMNRSVQRRGGVFRKGVLKVDMMLSSSGPNPNIAAVEVQGRNHDVDNRVEHRDEIKARCVECLHRCELFEVDTCEPDGCLKTGVTRSGRQIRRVHSDKVSHSESKACEIAEYLNSK